IHSFGGNCTMLGGFGGNGMLGGGFNQIQVALLTNVTADGGHNVYIQQLDANAVQVLQTAIQSFGGNGMLGGGFGGNGMLGGGFSLNPVDLLTAITAFCCNNEYGQRLDAVAAQLTQPPIHNS